MTAHRQLVDSFKADRERLKDAAGTNYNLESDGPNANELVYGFNVTANTTVTIPYAKKSGLNMTCYVRTYTAGTLTLQNEGSEAMDAAGRTSLALAAALKRFEFVSVYDGTNYVWRDRASTAAEQMATTPGVGITGAAESIVTAVERKGDMIVTTILVDLTGLNSGGTINDIIGDDGSGVAHLGQITAERNGTIIGGKMECLELPAGGDPDINVYSADEATGVEDTLITALTETQLVNAGDAVAGSTVAFTALPAANQYLYLACGAVTDATYTAGKLLITLFGK